MLPIVNMGEAMQDKTINTLNFMVLNVHGLSQKLKKNYFVDVLKKYDCIAMVETWTSKQSNITLKGYSNFACGSN